MQERERPRRVPVLRKLWGFLDSLDLASLLLLLLVLLAAVGSCFPGRPGILGTDDEALSRWERDIRDRYGRLTGVLRTMGAFRWFRSPIVWVPAGLLIAATLACTVNRWQAVWRRAFRRPVACPEALLKAGDYRAEIESSASADWVSALQIALERRGFHVRSVADDDVVSVRGDRNRLAPLATLVTHAAVLVLALGLVISGLWGWRQDVVLNEGEMTRLRPPRRAGDSTSLHVRAGEARVTRYADGSVAGYDLEVSVGEGPASGAPGHIRLNDPLIYRGIAFYLQAYASGEDGYRVTVRAVSDPGYAMIVVSGLLLFLGLTVTLTFPPCTVVAQVDARGTIQLAGRPSRRVWDFDREFEPLVEEVSEAVDETANP